MVLNETVNQTVNTSSNLSNSSIINTEALNATLAKVTEKAGEAAAVAHGFLPLIFIRLWDLVAAPFRHAEMLWIIFPLFFSLIVLELYFDRHGDEEIGWAAALANSLVLIFVAIDLVKRSFENATPWSVLKTIGLSIFGDGTLPITPQVLILILFLGAFGIVVTIVNYFHLLPKKLAYILSHHAPINYLAYFAIAIVYSDKTASPIPFDIPTLIAAALLFVLLLLIVFSVKRFFRRWSGSANGWSR